MFGFFSQQKEYLQEQRPIKLLSDVDKFNKKDGITVPLNTVDMILSEEKSIKELYNDLIDSKLSPIYISLCIQYCLTIRPHQFEKLINLLSLFISTFGCSITRDRHVRSIMEQRGLIEKEEVENTYYGNRFYGNRFYKLQFDELTFGKSKIKQIIIDDDVEAFSRFIQEPKFDPNSYKICSSDFHLSYVDTTGKLTLVQILAFYGATKCIRVALLNSYDINNVERFAVAGGSLDIIKLLEQKNVCFDDCFDVAIQYHRNDIADWLLKNNKCQKVSIESTIEEFNNRAFFFIVKNYPIKFYSNILDEAISTNNFELVKYITEKNFNRNEYQYYNYNCLDNVSREICLYLLESNIWEPYEIMGELCSRGYLDRVKELKGKFVIDFHKKIQNTSFLHIAIQNGHLDIANFLINECGVDLLEVGDKGLTTLHYACMQKNFDFIKYLVDTYHFDINKPSYDGKTPLSLASQYHNDELFDYLIYEKHASISEKAFLDFPNEYKEKVKNILELHKACEKGDLSMVKKLIEEEHVYVDHKYKGKTAFHVACSSNKLGIVKYLIEEAHANKNEEISGGRTLYQIAKGEVLSYLKTI